MPARPAAATASGKTTNYKYRPFCHKISPANNSAGIRDDSIMGVVHFLSLARDAGRDFARDLGQDFGRD